MDGDAARQPRTRKTNLRIDEVGYTCASSSAASVRSICSRGVINENIEGNPCGDWCVPGVSGIRLPKDSNRYEGCLAALGPGNGNDSAYSGSFGSGPVFGG